MRVASGGTALDPEVVTQLMGASRRTDTLTGLSGREREVLGLMAEGRTNSGHRREPGRLRGGGRKARGQHLFQAGLGGDAHRPPEGCWRCCDTWRDDRRQSVGSCPDGSGSIPPSRGKRGGSAPLGVSVLESPGGLVQRHADPIHGRSYRPQSEHARIDAQRTLSRCDGRPEAGGWSRGRAARSSAGGWLEGHCHFTCPALGLCHRESVSRGTELRGFPCANLQVLDGYSSLR